MRLKNLVLKNFRMFENHTFSFKPITIIAGPNGSGKSSLFKSLLLLKDSQERNGLSFLEFNDSARHSLGKFASIVTHKEGEKKEEKEKKEINFELTFDHLESRFQKTSLEDIKKIKVIYGFKKTDDVEKNERDGVLTKFEIFVQKEDANERAVFSLEDSCDDTREIKFKVNIAFFFDALSKEALIEQPIHRKIRINDAVDYSKLFQIERLKEEIIESSKEKYQSFKDIVAQIIKSEGKEGITNKNLDYQEEELELGKEIQEKTQGRKRELERERIELKEKKEGLEQRLDESTNSITENATLTREIEKIEERITALVEEEEAILDLNANELNSKNAERPENVLEKKLQKPQIDI